MAKQKQETLHCYLNSSSEPSTSGTTSADTNPESDDRSEINEQLSLNTSSDFESSSDKMCEVDPHPKRSRKSISTHHRKSGISQLWAREL